MIRAVKLTAGIDRLGEVRSLLAADLPGEFASLTPSVELILEEFLVNVVNHAYGGGGGPLEVGLRLVAFDGAPHLALRVVDWGPPFNPFSDAAEPDVSLDLDDRPVGGLGIALIRSMAAHHSYHRDRGANTVEVWIRSAGPPRAD